MTTFSLDGVSSDQFMTVTSVDRDPATIARAIVETPGRDGAWYGSTRRSTRPFGVIGYLYGADQEECATKLDDLNAWLPIGTTAALVFDDAPDVTYNVMLDGAVSVEAAVLRRKVTFTLVADDPYGYGAAQTFDLAAGAAPVGNDGNADTWPVFSATMDADALGIGFAVGDERVLVGSDPDVNVTPVDPTTRILNDDCSSLSGWTTGTNADNGAVAGAMQSVGGRFYPSSVGAGAAWHGPTSRRALSSSVADFTASASVNLDNLDILVAVDRETVDEGHVLAHGCSDGSFARVSLVTNAAGSVTYHYNKDYTLAQVGGVTKVVRKAIKGKYAIASGASLKVSYKYLSGIPVGQVELYVLNTSHVAIAKIGIMDGSAKGPVAALYGWLGTTASKFSRTTDAKGNHLNGFTGTLSIERKGTHWHLRLSGKNSSGHSVAYDWHIITSAVTANVADIELRIAGFGTYTLTPASFNGVSVIRYNTVSGTPRALLAGETVTVDVGQRKVYVDGVQAMDKLSPLSKWPKLAPGPSDVITTSDTTFTAATCVVVPRWQ